MLLTTLAGPGSNPPGWQEDVAQQLGRYPFIAGACILLLALGAGITAYRLRRSSRPVWRHPAIIAPILLAVGAAVLAQRARSVYAAYTSPDGLREFDGGALSHTLQTLDSFTTLAIVATLACILVLGVYVFVLADPE